MSSYITTNIGAPQGCIFSPLLFTLYTSECRSTDSATKIIKYADDTVLLGLLNKKSNELAYRDCITGFVNWCSDNHLILNTKKTKEIIFDFSRNASQHDGVTIANETIDIVEDYKYLGTYIDSKLKWTRNIENVCSKANRRLYHLRKLKKCGVDSTLLSMFYDSVIGSVISFCITAWYGGLSADLVQSLHRIAKTANKIICDTPVTSVPSLHENKINSMVVRTVNNNSHPLRGEFHVLRSGQRLRVHKCKTNRLKNSFIPQAIIHINNLSIDVRLDLMASL
jgi:hypothetical protein